MDVTAAAVYKFEMELVDSSVEDVTAKRGFIFLG